MLSEAERRYLKDPGAFERGYARYLRHAIRVKVDALKEELPLLQLAGFLPMDLAVLGSASRVEPPVLVDPVITVGDRYLKAFEQLLLDRAMSSRKVHDYVRTVRFMAGELDGVLTPASIRAFLAARPNPKTRNDYVCVLRRFADALRGLGVEASWLYGFEFAVPRKVFPKTVPSMDGLRAFYEALDRIWRIPGARHRLGRRCFIVARVVFLGLLSSGLRIGEFLGLRVQDVDFGMRMVVPEGRQSETTKRSWCSFLSREAMDVLQAYREEYPPRPGMLVLPGTYGVDGMISDMDNIFYRASKASGVKVTPHLLRSIFADRLGKRGVPDRFIDAFCGRLPPEELARHYSDYRPESLKVLHLIAEPYLTLYGRTDHIHEELKAAVTNPDDLPYLLARLGLSPDTIRAAIHQNR